MSEYTAQILRDTYEEMTAQAIAELTFTTDLIGGQPADRAGIEAFCQHQLKLAGDELQKAVARILQEEIGEREVAAAEGAELKERESYGVNALRRDPDACAWLGDWQIKACLKCAASRIGLFVKTKGSKGDLAELGQVRAYGISKGLFPNHIRLITEDGKPYLARAFRRFMGRVNTPQGAKSIVHDSEFAPPGCRLAFEFRFPPGKLTEENIVAIMACAQQVGLGSAKSLECGKFRIDRLVVNMNK